MQLFFVRHGESEANIAREFSNRGFRHPLTPRGIAQAQALARRLAGNGIAAIYSSPLQRAVQTAEILAAAWGGVPITRTAALREWDVGIYEGTTAEDGWAAHRQIQEDWFVRRLWERRLPGGESFAEIRTRFVPLVEQLQQQPWAENTAVALVGHGGLYHAMLPLVLPNIDHAFVTAHPFDNTAYALAETGADGMRCREWCGIALD